MYIVLKVPFTCRRSCFILNTHTQMSLYKERNFKRLLIAMTKVVDLLITVCFYPGVYVTVRNGRGVELSPNTH